MNEHIENALKLATTIEHGVNDGFDRVIVDQEKFAKLIIKMCADRAFHSVLIKSSAQQTALDIEGYFGITW